MAIINGIINRLTEKFIKKSIKNKYPFTKGNALGKKNRKKKKIEKNWLVAFGSQKDSP